MRTAAKVGTVLSRNRHRTAISRTDYSRPISVALADGLIESTTTVFDFGCGLGDDIRYLDLRGIKSWGWDPAHRQNSVLAPAQVVNLGYVVNVIEDLDERVECLLRAWSYAEKALIVSARLTSDTSNLTPAGRYGDGVVTSIGTFQKFYDQSELKNWLNEHLPEPAVAAGPGVFYIFRGNEDRIGFLASRYRRRSRSALPSTKTSIEEHKELLSPLIAFFERRGRAPGDDELPEGDAIRKRFCGGQLAGGTAVGSARTRCEEAEVWKRIIITRAQDLLLFLALSRFDGRPRFGQLPMGVRRDIKSIFSSYRNACEESEMDPENWTVR